MFGDELHLHFRFFDASMCICIQNDIWWTVNASISIENLKQNEREEWTFYHLWNNLCVLRFQTSGAYWILQSVSFPICQFIYNFIVSIGSCLEFISMIGAYTIQSNEIWRSFYTYEMYKKGK